VAAPNTGGWRGGINRQAAMAQAMRPTALIKRDDMAMMASAWRIDSWRMSAILLMA